MAKVNETGNSLHSPIDNHDTKSDRNQSPPQKICLPTTK